MSTVDDTTTQMVDLGAIQVTYTESGGGAPLILIHGGESDRNAFRVLFPHLGDGIRAIAYDQRDSGECVNPSEPYDIADLAQDLASFIAALGLEQAHLLGVSFGGAVAMHTALRHPERVASVTLVATLPRATGAIDRASEVSELTPEARRAAMFDLLFTADGMRSNPDLAGLGSRALTERPRELMARRIAAVRDHDVIEQLPSMQVPAMVIHGTDDPIAPFELAELTAERIPGAVLRPIRGGRHGIATEYAADVAAHVRQFIGLGPA